MCRTLRPFAGLVDFAVAETGRLDVLFNNVGIGYGRTVQESPDDAFEYQIAVHLFGAFHGMRAAIPVMRTQNAGRIINTGSRVAESMNLRTPAMPRQKRRYERPGRWLQQRLGTQTSLLTR
jgi:NAD(P)-dependent dehydrogenase (short-subunit alcohol dehydrogenase family)